MPYHGTTVTAPRKVNRKSSVFTHKRGACSKPSAAFTGDRTGGRYPSLKSLFSIRPIASKRAEETVVRAITQLRAQQRLQKRR